MSGDEPFESLRVSGAGLRVQTERFEAGLKPCGYDGLVWPRKGWR